MFKKMNNKKRRIIGFSILASTITFSLTTTLMVAPGVGVESLMFIKSVERQLKQITPKGKFVLDSKSIAYPIVKGVIKKSFSADAVSTINFENPEELKLKPVFEEYAAYWFEEHFAENSDIDLYDIGQSLIELDKSIAGKFHSMGLVNTGFSWIFNQGGLGEIYSQNIRDLVSRQQTIENQHDYELDIEDNGGMGNAAGVEVSHSRGANIVNNKVWFLNKQIETIKAAIAMHTLGGSMGVYVFKDKTINSNDSVFSARVTTSDLYHPDFVATLTLLRIAIVLFALNVVFIPVGATMATLALKGTHKEKKIKKNSEEE